MPYKPEDLALIESAVDQIIKLLVITASFPSLVNRLECQLVSQFPGSVNPLSC